MGEVVSKRMPSDKELLLLARIGDDEGGRKLADVIREAISEGLSYETLYSLVMKMEKDGWVGSHVEQGLVEEEKYVSRTRSGRIALERSRDHHQRLANIATLSLNPAGGDPEFDALRRSRGSYAGP